MPNEKCPSIKYWWDGREKEKAICVLDLGHDDRHQNVDGYHWNNEPEKIYSEPESGG